MAAVLAYLALRLALQFALPSQSSDPHRHPGGFVLVAIVDGVLLASIPLVFVLRCYSDPLSTFGFSTRRLAAGALAGVAAGSVFAAVALGYGHILESFDAHSRSPYVALLQETDSTAVKASVVFVIVFLAPVAEEIFFRSFIFSVLKIATSTWIATATSSILFGLAHFSMEWFVAYCLLGAVLAVLLQRTGTLVAPIAAHMVLNVIGLALSLEFADDSAQLLSQ